VLSKPGCDLYVTGSVRSARHAGFWGIHISAGKADNPLLEYRCAVTGPRHWQHTLFSGWHLSEIEDTQEVPIRYELAWGGRKAEPDKPPHLWKSHKPNPSGSGYSFASYSRDARIPAHQWEPHSGLFGPSPMQLKQLTGLGPVAEFWSSRSRYAGTHDATWQKTNADDTIKDYPRDFDLRFFQCAHPSLQSASPFRGDEALRLKGLLPMDGWLHTQLPGWGIAIVDTQHKKKRYLPLDTIHIELGEEQNQVHLTWHLTLPHTLDIQQVHLQKEKL
jgi:hypothetical protein